MEKNTAHVFTLMVDNEFGVLTRITALIRRSGWNIRSLAVAETALAEVSRLTVCLECRHHSVEDMLYKMNKLACVRQVSLFSSDNQVAREMAIVRLRIDLQRLKQLCGALQAEIIHNASGEQVVAISAAPADLEQFISQLEPAELLDIARTGTIALSFEDTQERN